MLGWLKEIQFSNGNVPQVNDSTNHIAPASNDLFDYAKRLFIQSTPIILNESGYRKIVKDNFEIIVDVGNIGPDYIPGHAHSDTFNFILYANGKPLIVDTGTSTYEKNERRQKERSTKAHNTVEINGQNQSDVWGGFRVAKRARVTELKETKNLISATHDGYKDIDCYHNRTFIFLDKEIFIMDKIIGNKKSIAYLHFHPNIKVKLDKQFVKGVFGYIFFDENAKVSLTTYKHVSGFNKTETALKVVVEFEKQLHTKLVLL